MNYCRQIFLPGLFFLLTLSLSAQNPAPVTPNASPEARALLAFMQGLSGKHILSGQHNFPISGARNSEFAGNYIGEMPVVWSQDFGFAADGDKDSYLARHYSSARLCVSIWNVLSSTSSLK
ncbi:MAG: hypothetical protein R3D00_19280 [Bacteroidia bacterium]